MAFAWQVVTVGQQTLRQKSQAQCPESKIENRKTHDQNNCSSPWHENKIASPHDPKQKQPADADAVPVGAAATLPGYA